MSLNRNNRVRLTVESLEGRLLADAKMPVVVPAAAANLAVVHTAVDSVSQVITGLPAATQTKSAAAATAANAGFAYTAFTIDNNSNATVGYSIKWGNGGWTSYTIA